VLRRPTSHLLLIRTNLGYGTVLTAACTRQGCSATDFIIIIIIIVVVAIIIVIIVNVIIIVIIVVVVVTT
jgi:hypothetical protein